MSCIVLTDLSRTLREEERNAWQRLVRVLGHEMNNSLAPIKSIAGSLETLSARSAAGRLGGRRTQRFESDRDARGFAQPVHAGLCAAGQASASAEGTTRSGRTHSARRGLGNAHGIEVLPSRKCRFIADGAQIEQLLINILHNAVDASLETGGAVSVGWREAGDCVEVFVRDEGPGIMNPTNLFVPFFTTKPTGSGIGLASVGKSRKRTAVRLL